MFRKFCIFIAVLMCVVGIAAATPDDVSVREFQTGVLHITGVEPGDTVGVRIDGKLIDWYSVFVPTVGFDDCRLFYDFSDFKNGTFKITANGETVIAKSWVRYPGDRVSTGDEPVDEVMFYINPLRAYRVSLAGEPYDLDDMDVFITFSGRARSSRSFSVFVPRMIGEFMILIDGSPVFIRDYDVEDWSSIGILGGNYKTNGIPRDVISSYTSTRFDGISTDLGRYSKLQRV